MLKKHFPLPVSPLQLSQEVSVSSQWFVALGAGLRGAIPRRKDRGMSIASGDALTEFVRLHVLSFVRFWAIALPAAMLPILASYALAYWEMNDRAAELKAEIARASVSSQSKQLGSYEVEADRFNRTVATLVALQTASPPQIEFIEGLLAKMGARGIVPLQIKILGPEGSVAIQARAPTKDGVLLFKKDLESDGRFQTIELPLTDIRVTAQGLSFSIHFIVSSAPAESAL